MTWLAPSAQAGIAVTAMAGIGELGKLSGNLLNVPRPKPQTEIQKYGTIKS
jgi:hypothetical protein